MHDPTRHVQLRQRLLVNNLRLLFFRSQTITTTAVVARLACDTPSVAFFANSFYSGYCRPRPGGRFSGAARRGFGRSGTRRGRRRRSRLGVLLEGGECRAGGGRDGRVQRITCDLKMFPQSLVVSGICLVENSKLRKQKKRRYNRHLLRVLTVESSSVANIRMMLGLEMRAFRVKNKYRSTSCRRYRGRG